MYGQELCQSLDLAGGMGPEAPATTEVAATVWEKLALARQCVEQAQAYQKAYTDKRRWAV